MTESRPMMATRVAIPFGWAAAMICAGFLDPWLAIPVAAFCIMAAVLTFDRLLIVRLLRPSRRAVLIGLGAAALMIAVTYLLFPYAVHAAPVVGDGTAAIYGAFRAGRGLPLVLSLVIPIVIAEELMWRGAFQELIVSGLPRHPVMTVLLSAAIYAVVHIPVGSPLLVAVAFLCGLYWSALRAATKSLIPSLIAHLLWDIAIIVIPLRTG